jgi:hypothetical protein
VTASPAELRALRARLGPEAYKAACIHACWEAGDLSYALHAGQVNARAMAHRVHAEAVAAGGVKRALLNIARRWGKTFFFVAYALEVMLRNPGARVPYAAMTETSVREFVEPILRWFAQQAPKHLAPVARSGEWVIPGRESRLIVKGCEDRHKADRLRGPAAHAAIVDEAGFIPCLSYVVQEVIAPQLATTDGMMLVGSSAPESPEHEFWTLADEAQARGAYLHATVYDAPHLSARQIASLAAEAGGEDSLAWQREGLSKRIVDPTRAVYPEWAQAELEAITAGAVHVVGECERPSHYDVYVVGDLGFADLTFVLLAYYDFTEARIVVIDEVVLQRQTSDVIEAAVRERQELHFPGVRPLVRALEGDAMVVASIRKEERIARGEAERGQPEDERADAEPDSARWNQIAFVQMEAAVNAARLRIKRRGILVHPRCVNLIAHMRGALWNRTRTSFERVERNGRVEHHYDGAAALAYLVKRLQPNRNPFPVLPPGITRHTHHIPHELTPEGQREKRRAAWLPRKVRR